MYVYVQTLIIIEIFVMMLNAERCLISTNDSTGFRCIADDSLKEVSAKDCHNTEHCCLTNGVCYAKPRKSPPRIKPDKNDKQMIDEMRDIVKTANLEDTVTDRNPFPYPPLPFGGEAPYPGFSVLPTFACRGRPQFPGNCDVDPKTARYVKNPPIDIPYCLRIPCDPNKPELELKPAECRSSPGCYFDKRLSDFRIYFGNSVLPGVPVCHLAIRNSVFQEEASKIIGKNKTWSPYLTECLLKRFNEVIRTPKDGCRDLKILKYFKHRAKMAAWEGINAYGCVLMNACWTTGGCFYPVDLSNLTLSSHEENEHNEDINYGKVKCQNYDDSTPKKALKSYHACLISGCKLSLRSKSAYYNYLFQFGEEMSVADHWKFWRKAKSGEISAHNVDKFRFVSQKDTNITPFSLVIRYPPNNSTSNLLNEILTPNSAAVLNVLKSTLGIQNSNQQSADTTSLFAQIRGFQMPCSSMYTSLGSRPCGPSHRPEPKKTTHCPYKPVSVKRFKPLRGSFKGCCQTNHCYLPKEKVRTARSGAAVYYSEWSYWTECSASCGPGTKRRWRNCIGVDESQCTLALSEEVKCENTKCTSWSDWGPWSLCSMTCLGGIISRTRSCMPFGDYCPGPKEEVRSCNTGACDGSYGHWSSWIGSCEPCGKTIYRSRECRKKICAQSELYETKRCPIRCGSWTMWSSYGQCKFNFVENACLKVRRRECVNEENKPALCHGDSQEYQKCNVC